MTVDQASDRYLQIVCPVNIAGADLNSRIQSVYDSYNADTDPDIAALSTSAAQNSEATRAAVGFVDEEYWVWPDDVAKQMEYIRSSYMSDLAVLNSLTQAKTFDDVHNTTWPEPSAEQAAAGQEIRYQLGLLADTTVSCEGFDEGHAVLSAERTEREAELGSE